MKNNLIHLAVILAAVFLTTGACHAQAAADEKSVKCRFRLYGWDESITDLHYNLKGTDVAMVIYQDARSIFYDYSGPEMLTLYRLKTDKDGNVVREPAAQANLATGGSWPLIVVSNYPAKPGTYQTFVLKDDLNSFPPGSYAFTNFTASIVGGMLGTEPFTLAPGDNKLVDGKPKDSGTTLAALFYKLSGDKKEALYTNNWAIRPQTRTRVFVRTSQETPTGIVARRLVESTVFPPEKKEALTQTN
jgi:hypothetical protein